MSDVKDKVVIITGGSLGIGKVMAKVFAKNKARVIICSRSQQDLDKATAEIMSEGNFCDNRVVDVARPAQVKKLIDYVYQKYGRLDVLINCAGIIGPIGPLETNDIKMWEKTLHINLVGTVNCTYYAIPLMKKQGRGKIINMAGGGLGGVNIMTNFSAYMASKAAVAVFTELVAKELKEFNIQVNAISPGAVNTRLLDQVLAAGEAAGKDFLEKSEKQKAEGGISPEKASELALFLASDDSSFVTGKILSAIWDDYANFGKIKGELQKKSLYNLRRIDNFEFYEKT